MNTRTPVEHDGVHHRLLYPALLLGALLVSGCRDDAQTITQPPSPATPVVAPVPAVTPVTSSIRFRDATTDWGMDFTRDDDIGPLRRILEANGGGVGVLDYDMDGWPDLLLTNGCPLPLSRAAVRVPDPLYRNLAGTRVISSGPKAGIAAVGYHHGCTVGDWNSDGFPDLYIAGLGKNLFYVNQGDGTFTEEAADLGIEVRSWSSSPVFADLDGDGFLDLYVTNYVVTGDDPPRVCVTEVPLLFEVGGESRFDRVVVVTAPRQLREQRRHAPQDNRDARLLPDREKVARADFHFVNTGTFEELDTWVAGVMTELTNGAS